MLVADVVDRSRALEPRHSGFADADGVRIAYEVFGEGEDTILLLPPWAIVHSRFWKGQVPYLARPATAARTGHSRPTSTARAGSSVTRSRCSTPPVCPTA